jgi:surface protein
MNSVFRDAYEFNSDLSKWDTDKVSNMILIFSDSGFTRTLCGGKWESLKSQWTGDNAGSSTARYGCCPENSFMSNPFFPLDEALPMENRCSPCLSSTVENDEISCNGACPEGMVYLDTYYGCVRKLPDGNGGCALAGRTGGTLNRIVDNWLDTSTEQNDYGSAPTRLYIENIYGPIAEWDVSFVTNFYCLFNGVEDENVLKRTFNADISKWNVANAINMRQMFNGAAAFNGDLSAWSTGKVTQMTQRKTIL